MICENKTEQRKRKELSDFNRKSDSSLFLDNRKCCHFVVTADIEVANFLIYRAFLRLPTYSHSISRIYLVVSIRTYILYFVVYYLYYPCYSEYTFFCIKKCIKKEEVIHCRPTNTVALLAEQSFLYQRINSHCIRSGRLMLVASLTKRRVYRKQLGEPYNYLG